MQEEKGLVEISLPRPPSSQVTEKPTVPNYFGNIRLMKMHASHGPFPYEQFYENEYEKQSQSSIYRDNTKLYGLNLIETDERPNKMSSLRQMHCPECQQRLDEESVLLERPTICCIPLSPLDWIRPNYLKRHENRRIYCKNCGAQMGYWKQS